MKPLSGWWAGSHHNALGRTTDDAVRLAIALGAIKSAVRVVDRHIPPMMVQWAQVNPDEKAPVRSMSYTDFAGDTININSMPMRETGIGHADALDICIAFGLHEAGHSQESRDRYKYLIKREVFTRPNARPDTAEDMEFRRVLTNPATVFDRKTGEAIRETPAFQPMRIAAYLWNLVEDVRMESVTARNWPGFRPYFAKMLDYLWSELRKHHELPKKYESDLVKRMRVVFLACRFPERFDPKDKRLAEEVAWWQAWQYDYLTDAVDTPTTIQRGLDRLAEDSKTQKELEKLSGEEKAERERGERLRDQLDRLINEGVNGSFEVCITEEGEIIPLDAETAEEVRKLVREDLTEASVVVTGYGVSNPPVRVRKPEETPESRRAYIGRPDAEVEALRAALVFRPETPEYSERLMKSGQIDEEELYRLATGDMRVFGQRVIESKPDVFMGLLVDLSGSMYGWGSHSKLTIAQRLAQLFVWAVHDQEGIATQVWGHTGDLTDEASEVFRLWEPGDPLSRLGLIAEIEHSDNYDGHAIGYVAAQVAQNEQPEKVLIVLSDGLPSGQGYGGKPAQNHVRETVKWAAQRGVRVIQLAIDPSGLRPDEQAAMYGTEGEGWIGFRDYASLPRQLTSILSRYI